LFFDENLTLKWRKIMRWNAGERVLRVESVFESLSTVKNAENDHQITRDFKSDGDTPPKAEDSQSGSNVVPLRPAIGETLQALALFHDGFSVVGCNFGRRGCCDVKEQLYQLIFSFWRVDNVVNHPARSEESRAAASEARTFSEDIARSGSTFMAS
jgi:hypothetical protein